MPSERSNALYCPPLQADAQRSARELEAAPVSQPLLRSTFDFAFFFEGMCCILDSEHAQVLLRPSMTSLDLPRPPTTSHDPPWHSMTPHDLR